MEDKALYTQILGIQPPWKIDHIDLDMEQERVDVYVEWPAKADNKHVVIDFYTDWCSWCKVMDEKTFSVPKIESYLFKHFVPIRIDAESIQDTVFFKGQQMTFRELTSAFRVSGFPSVAFLTPDADIITIVPGYIEKEMFLNILRYMQKECYRQQMSLEEFIEKGCSEKNNG